MYEAPARGPPSSVGKASPTRRVQLGADLKGQSIANLRGVTFLRRALLALSLASLMGGLMRLRGKGGVPPQEGGWRELRLPPQ